MIHRGAILHLAGAGAVFAALASGLVACGQDTGGTGKPPPLPMAPGPHVAVKIDADKATHFQMLCDVRTYEVAVGQFANRYGVDKSGSFQDVIPSPNAHCTIKLMSGPSVTLTLTKTDLPPGQSATAKDTVTTTITTPGDGGKITLHIW